MDELSSPLPPMSAATLLRALFKVPARRPAPAGDDEAPALRHSLARIDLAEAARYRGALGFGGARLPLTYYYLLAQRAHLATMLGGSFPFRPVGAIHVDNALEAGVQPDPERGLALVSTVETGEPSAGGAVRSVLATRASQDGRFVFGCRSTYLVVRGRRRGGPYPPAAPAAGLAPLASWWLAPSSGRGYAALSGDWNPIHLWPWSARLLGRRQPIIHGMHTLGRVCAELERAGGRPVIALDGRFRATIPLGGKVDLAAALDAGRYQVEAAGRVAVEGGFRLA